MILTAALIGAVVGAAAVFMLFHTGMLAERSGVAVLLSAIAVFYPVFAAIEEDWAAVLLHIGIFSGFTWLALQGFQKGMHILAGGLIAHGFFDIGIETINAPGPAWWPFFCAAIDIVMGVALIRLLQTGKIAP